MRQKCTVRRAFYNYAIFIFQELMQTLVLMKKSVMKIERSKEKTKDTLYASSLE